MLFNIYKPVILRAEVASRAEDGERMDRERVTESGWTESGGRRAWDGERVDREWGEESG